MKKKLAGVLLVVAVLVAVGCQVPANNVVPAVFTTEQVVCMVDGLASGLLTGEAQVVAADIQAACPGLTNLTQDVINFINAFRNLTPSQKAHWTEWAVAHKQK